MKQTIRLHISDSVVVALTPLDKGTAITIDDEIFILSQSIDRGHKISIKNISAGEHILKYGASIGRASAPIKRGDWVHTHNVQTNLSDQIHYQFQNVPLAKNLSQDDSPEIQIYRRENGEIGIRNELWIVPTVGCVNGMAAQMVKRFLKLHPDLDIDGVHVFPHQFGCSQLGDDLECTRTLLQRICLHPNAGGVLVLGLGCESNQVSLFKNGVQSKPENRLKFLITQEVDDEVEAGLELMEALYDTMRHDKREAGKLSEVHFGLECGGSDGLSGITANPLLGEFSDYLIARGGTSVLTEVPEMFGAETLLMERCEEESTFEELVTMINDFKSYYTQHNQPIYENPSPGNKNGGITTLEDKSLGCTQKSGRSPVKAVLEYGEPIRKPGLNLLNSPGNDAIATSALGASGCQMVLFTTGRGTPYGGFVPTLKIATNTEMAQRKKHWIDFNAGPLVEHASMENMLAEFIQLVAEVCSGKECKNEINDVREIAIWKKGVTL